MGSGPAGGTDSRQDGCPCIPLVALPTTDVPAIERRIVVLNAAVTIARGIQPGILSRVMSAEFLDAGLAGRLLMAMPPRPVKVWSEKEIDPDTEERYFAAGDFVHALTWTIET